MTEQKKANNPPAKSDDKPDDKATPEPTVQDKAVKVAPEVPNEPEFASEPGAREGPAYPPSPEALVNEAREAVAEAEVAAHEAASLIQTAHDAAQVAIEASDDPPEDLTAFVKKAGPAVKDSDPEPNKAA